LQSDEKITIEQLAWKKEEGDTVEYCHGGGR